MDDENDDEDREERNMDRNNTEKEYRLWRMKRKWYTERKQRMAGRETS